MPRSFEQLGGAPGAPLKRQPANAQDVLAWLEAAQVKLQDAQLKMVSPGTRMDRVGCRVARLPGSGVRARLAGHQ